MSEFDDKMIECIARVMCAADGVDPNLSSTFRQYDGMTEAETTKPNWQAYRAEAKRFLHATKALETVKFEALFS